MRTVVYLALGGRRLRAAEHYAAALTAGGDRVVVIIAPGDAWTEVPGVEVHRLTPREARKKIRALAPALLIAGDPAAMAVAWAIGPRQPVRLEPLTAGHPAPADLAVLSPWYPAPDDPFAGAFVRASTAAVRPYFDRVAILHTQNWYYDPKGYHGQAVGVAAERLAVRSGPAVVEDTAEGELTRVAVPCPAGGHYPTYADAETDALRAILPTGRIEAPIVHAHTGFLAGVVAARLVRPDARLVVTEHSTFLPKVFAQDGARESYAAMLDRADALLCVGRYLYDQLLEYFPEHAGKLAVLPNATDFDRFAVRSEPPLEPLRWLYIGRLMAHKGVRTLVDAFAIIAAEDPRVSLTLVGTGPLQAELDARIAELGLGDRIVRRPPVAPDDVAALLHEHDLLVHASVLETFGMTVVEAIATGTPVLVAGSQGPAETLAGLADMAGLMFEPTEDPEVVAEGYRKLRARFDDLDLVAARAELMARYGREAVGARLYEIYTSGETTVHPEGPAPVVRRPGTALERYARRVITYGSRSR
jgi:glycosyltransferase involved in cell wall biosynthesis